MKQIYITVFLVLAFLLAIQLHIGLQEHPVRRIVRYVRPGNYNGTQTGESWENAYPSLAAWNDAEATDLIKANAISVAYVSPPDNVYYESQILTMKGWIIDHAHYPEVIYEQ